MGKEGSELAGFTSPLCRGLTAGPLAAAAMETNLKRCQPAVPVHQGWRGLLARILLPTPAGTCEAAVLPGWGCWLSSAFPRGWILLQLTAGSHLWT